jgi:predicted nucleotidyltransferase
MDDKVDSVVSRIAEAIHPQKIILFGPRARGNARPDSDIDLLLICNKPVSKRDVKVRIRALFPRPDFSLDLFILTPEEYEWQKDVVSTLGRIASIEGLVCCG